MAEDSEQPGDRVRSPNYADIYINGANVGGSAYDLIITGTVLRPKATGSDRGYLDEVVTLRQSPTHFKSLVGMMLETIAFYEDQYGTLPLPPEQAERGAFLDSIRPAVLAHVTERRNRRAATVSSETAPPSEPPPSAHAEIEPPRAPSRPSRRLMLPKRPRKGS